VSNNLIGSRKPRDDESHRQQRNSERTTYNCDSLRRCQHIRAAPPRVSPVKSIIARREPPPTRHESDATTPAQRLFDPKRTWETTTKPIPFSRSRPPPVKNPRKTTSRMRSTYGGPRKRHAKPRVLTRKRTSSPDRSLLTSSGPSNLPPSCIRTVTQMQDFFHEETTVSSNRAVFFNIRQECEFSDAPDRTSAIKQPNPGTLDGVSFVPTRVTGVEPSPATRERQRPVRLPVTSRRN